MRYTDKDYDIYDADEQINAELERISQHEYPHLVAFVLEHQEETMDACMALVEKREELMKLANILREVRENKQ